MSSCHYRKSHCRDKTVVRLSYLHNGTSYTCKMTSLYWIRAHRSLSQLRYSWPSYNTEIFLQTIECLYNIQFIIILHSVLLKTVAEHKPDIRLTKDTPYLTLPGELWSVYWEDLGENWLCYDGATLYSQKILHSPNRRVRYGMPFVSSKPYRYPALVITSYINILSQ